MCSSINSKQDLPARNFIEVTSVDVSRQLQLQCDMELSVSSADPWLLTLIAQGSAEFLLKVMENRDVGFPPRYELATLSRRFNEDPVKSPTFR